MISNAGIKARLRGCLTLAFALTLGLSLASFHGAALAHVDGAWQAKGQSPAAGDARNSGAIVVADKHGKGNKNWKGNGNWKGDNWDRNWSNNNWKGKNWGKGWSNYNNNWNRNWNNRAYVRSWNHRPYYGEFIGGVVLGSILAASGAGVVPYAPAPYLCWYWADPYMYRGYWDYCY